jgi:hypothetical protein
MVMNLKVVVVEIKSSIAAVSKRIEKTCHVHAKARETKRAADHHDDGHKFTGNQAEGKQTS